MIELVELYAAVGRPFGGRSRQFGLIRIEKRRTKTSKTIQARVSSILSQQTFGCPPVNRSKI